MGKITSNWRQYWLALLLAFTLASPAWFLGKAFPVVGAAVFAILLGLLLGHFWRHKPRIQQGLAFWSKRILQTAVVCLGFGLQLQMIARVGRESLPIIVATISTALGLSYLLFKLWAIPRNTAILLAVGSAICGGSAIAATAPIIAAEEQEIASSIAVVFLFNVLAALIFPSLGQLLQLSDAGFALFAGTAVNDTSSVTAAASAWDALRGGQTNTLEIATIVKLTRTLAIIPISFVLALLTSRGGRSDTAGQGFSLRRALPPFIVLFFLAAIFSTVLASVNSSLYFGLAFKEASLSLLTWLNWLSKFLIVMAMAAIGLGTDVRKLLRAGYKPLGQGLLCWLSISVVSLTLQYLLRLW